MNSLDEIPITELNKDNVISYIDDDNYVFINNSEDYKNINKYTIINNLLHIIFDEFVYYDPYKAFHYIIKFIIKVKPNIVNEEVSSDTFLNMAVKNYNDDMSDIQLLIDNGADVNLENVCEIFPLANAIMDYNIEVADYLLKHNADIDKKFRGTTLLSYISGYNDEDNNLFYYLINNNADINSIDNDGLSILDHAIISGNEERIEYLRNKGAIEGNKDERIKQHYWQMVLIKDSDKIDDLIKDGLDINSQPSLLFSYNNTYNKEFTDYLRSNGAEIGKLSEEQRKNNMSNAIKYYSSIEFIKDLLVNNEYKLSDIVSENMNIEQLADKVGNKEIIKYLTDNLQW